MTKENKNPTIEEIDYFDKRGKVVYKTVEVPPVRTLTKSWYIDNFLGIRKRLKREAKLQVFFNGGWVNVPNVRENIYI